MSLWSRIANVLRGEALNREIDEELQFHIDEGIAQGRDPDEVRRAFGSTIRMREASRDVRLATWAESVRADMVFGWRQILKNKTASMAAVLSLGLAIGSCTAAFRLIDAMLLRPLPVANPERLYFLTFSHLGNDGVVIQATSFDYPAFRQLREAAKGSAELMAVSHPSLIDLTYGSENEMERARRQYVSGWALATFGLKPAAGRLLTAEDDVRPGAHPYAVLTYDYWSRRFGRDPGVVGRAFRIGKTSYVVVGVLEEGFTGTETGTITDLFLPTMMNAQGIDEPAMSWFRTWAQLRPGVNVELARQKLEASLRSLRRERVKDWSAGTPRERIEQYATPRVLLEPASAGVSWTQDTYRQSLWVLAALVGMVLLIACANVANLMSAQAASRARELALRVSIGAGRGRLIQLVLIEGALIAFGASMVGGAFAWWATPFVVNRINPSDNPIRLNLPGDWRVFGFAAALSLAVTALFALAPALRASAVKPISALKGGEDPHARRRLMNVLVAAQVAFCCLAHFASGLFVSSYERLASQPTGFSSERVLVLDTASATPQAHAAWDQLLEALRSTAGVEAAGLSRWALMSGAGWNQDVWVNGRGPDARTPNPYFHGISPGWLEAMQLPLLDGRDFRAGETYPNVAIVNQAFVREYLGGENPLGKSFEKRQGVSGRVRVTIIGYVRDARYSDMREAIRPTVYVPFRRIEGDVVEKPSRGTFVIRTAAVDPLPMAPALRRVIQQTRSDFYVSSIRTQSDVVRAHTVRERLLSMLSSFFAIVALLVAGIGLYGIVDYSVMQRRREIGIRVALGARAGHIIRRVTGDISWMVAIGAAVGLIVGVASEKYIRALLYGVRTTDFPMLALPVAIIAAAAAVASLSPVMRAVRIDPVSTIRAD